MLLRSIALGRRWLDEVLAGTSMDEIARREGYTKQHVANNIPLAFLAPDVVRAIIDARLPRGISARRIAQPELDWRASGRCWASAAKGIPSGLGNPSRTAST